MSDFKSPKLIKLYYKASTETTEGKAYLRNMSGSKLAGIFICHSLEQVEEIKASSNLTLLYNQYINDRRKMLNRYRGEKTSFVGYTSRYMRSLGSSFPGESSAGSIDDLYINLLDRVITDDNTRDGYDVIKDVISNYHHSVHIDNIIAKIKLGNDPVSTIDGHTTQIWRVAPDNSYYNGSSIEGDHLSLIASMYAKPCEDCDYIDYDEDSDSMSYVDGSDYYVCEPCRDDGYTYCGDCSYLHHADNMRWVERTEESYCENCYDSSLDSCIKRYDYTPYLTFYDYNKNVMSKVDNYKKHKLPFYGAELEVECNDSNKSEYAQEIMNYEGEEKYFYCKNDGSLSDGFEICFMPMTFNAIKNLNLWDSILKHRGRDKLQSFNTSTCGMHIHINREAFTDHHLFKFISFIHEFKGFIYLISQRKRAGEFNNYAKFNNGFKDRVKRSMVDSIKSKKESYNSTSRKYATHSTTTFGEKYVPVNLQHRDTVEVRIFKGNLLETSIRKNFEFVDSLYYFTRENPIYRLKIGEYLEFCAKDIKKYPNLNAFVDNNASKVKEILRFPLEIPTGLDY